MPRETINEVHINKYILQLDDNLSSSQSCNGLFISTCLLQLFVDSGIKSSNFASHLITLHCGVYSFLGAKVIIPVDDVDGEVTEWKDHSENKKQSNLILSE